MSGLTMLILGILLVLIGFVFGLTVGFLIAHKIRKRKE